MQVFGPTVVKITSQTNFDLEERATATVGAGGVPSGSAELPLAPGAPPVLAGQAIVIECRPDNTGFAQGAATAEAAAGNAPTWKLTVPLTRAWPESAQVWYPKQILVARLDDLKLRTGQSVIIEFEGTPGDYHATKLTDAGVVYGY